MIRLRTILFNIWGRLARKLSFVAMTKLIWQGLRRLAPDHILISPGPCTPNEAGISLSLIDHFKGIIPIFGVCLGHQSIGQAFGGDVIRAERLMHGKTSEIFHDGKTLFEGLPSPFIATRYHSLIVKTETLAGLLGN